MKTNTLPLRLRGGVISSSDDSITIGSRLDVSGARRFARAVARLAEREPAHVVIDLSRTRAVDSSGFGALMSGLRKLSESGATPIVVCANSSVRRLMDFAGIARTFAVVDRVTDARKMLSRATAEQTAATRAIAS